MTEQELFFENWNLFWNAFGAIGTTVGSIITAIAVFVAIMQYKQPLLKNISVNFNSAIGIIDKKKLYCISASNKGLRNVLVYSIYIKGRNQKILLNAAQDAKYSKLLPIEVEPERKLEIYFEEKKFKEIVKEALNDGVLSKRDKLIVSVEDALGKEYTHNTRIRISKFIKPI